MSAKDLIILAADKDLENALAGLLPRRQSLGIREVKADIQVHQEHDPGCARRGVPFLSIFARQYRHGLLIFDHQGSGREQTAPQELQNQLNEELAAAWGERARAIVLAPELEAWVWNSSPHVATAINWKGQPSLNNWLREQNWLGIGEDKPLQPKEAFRAALRYADTQPSAALYRQIAAKVSLSRCHDPAFQELRTILRLWFPLLEDDMRVERD